MPDDPADSSSSTHLPTESPATELVGATGLPVNVAAALAVMIPLIGGIVLLFLERKERFVRFYCVQSIVLGVLLGAAWMMLSLIETIFKPIPVLGSGVIMVASFIYGLFALVWLVIYFIALFKAFTGKTWAIPYLGPLAKKYMSPGSI